MKVETRKVKAKEQKSRQTYVLGGPDNFDKVGNPKKAGRKKKNIWYTYVLGGPDNF